MPGNVCWEQGRSYASSTPCVPRRAESQGVPCTPWRGGMFFARAGSRPRVSGSERLGVPAARAWRAP